MSLHSRARVLQRVCTVGRGFSKELLWMGVSIHYHSHTPVGCNHEDELLKHADSPFERKRCRAIQRLSSTHGLTKAAKADQSAGAFVGPLHTVTVTCDSISATR